jgi:hypothetical protein
MSATIDAAGLTIQTFDEILEEIVVALGVALSLTTAQTQRIREGVRSSLGQLARIEAEREVITQEQLLAVYNTLSILSTGAALDRVVRLLGVTRRPAAVSRVIGTAFGIATANIPDGTRLRYNPSDTIWLVADGPYVIGGGGDVEIIIESEDEDELEVAVDPETGFDDWTILDTVLGFDSFESTEQTVVGSAIETDAELRARAEVEAAITEVEGVTYVRTYDNYGPFGSVDPDGIPGKAINIVVEGGDDDEIAAAILSSRSAGAETFALAGPSAASGTATDSYGFVHTFNFNRVDEVEIWITCVLTTSTSEEAAPAGLVDTVAALLLEQAGVLFGIGVDVTAWRLVGAVHAAGLPGIDNVVVELSLDDGVLDPYSTAKRVITIRQRGAFDAVRIAVSED